MFVSYIKYKKLLDHSNRMTEEMFKEARLRERQAKEFALEYDKVVKEMQEYKKMYYDEFQKRIELLDLIKQDGESQKQIENYIKSQT
jgi:hypothetical protein